MTTNDYLYPATNEITIFVHRDKEEQYQLRIMNLPGQEILKKDFVAQTTIAVSDVRPKGLYFIEVVSKEGSFRKMERVVLK